MPPPPAQSAYMSINPLEPVLVFRNGYDAKEYQDHYNSLARIYKDRDHCCYLPIPPGLESVRTSRRGDVAFEFKTASQADDFGRVIRIGRMYPPEGVNGERYRRTVYVGQVQNDLSFKLSLKQVSLPTSPQYPPGYTYQNGLALSS